MRHPLGRIAALTALLTAGSLLAGVPGVSAPRQAPAATARSPFEDVPRTRPAYATVAYLQDELGVHTGYPQGKFAGKEAWTRYEFSVAAARMYLQLSRIVRRLDPSRAGDAAAVPDRPVVGGFVPADNERLRTAFRDADELRRLFAWYEPLLTELDEELPQLACDVPVMRQAVRAWQDRASFYAEKASAEEPEGAAEPPVPARAAKTGDREKVFQPVPAGYPAYTTCTLLADRMGVPTGYPAGTFDGRRILSRYEFAVALQRMHQQLKHGVHGVEAGGWPNPPPAPALPAPGTGTLDDRKLRQTFKDPGKLRLLLAWHAPLLDEFAAELVMIGSEVPALRREVRDWQERATALSAKAKALREPGKGSARRARGARSSNRRVSGA